MEPVAPPPPPKNINHELRAPLTLSFSQAWVAWRRGATIRLQIRGEGIIKIESMMVTINEMDQAPARPRMPETFNMHQKIVRQLDLEDPDQKLDLWDRQQRYNELAKDYEGTDSTTTGEPR